MPYEPLLLAEAHNFEENAHENELCTQYVLGNGVIVLSSDDEECFLPQDSLKVAQPLKKAS